MVSFSLLGAQYTVLLAATPPHLLALLHRRLHFILFFHFIDLSIYLFIYVLRILSRPHAIRAEPNAGLELTNREIMTRAKIQSPIFNQMSHPGAPIRGILSRERGAKEAPSRCPPIHLRSGHSGLF